MIAKHVPMKILRKSNFVGLVKYITNSKNKRERVGHVAIIHCHSHSPHDAALEVQAKQALNQRVESDKTYHLIVSFAAHENPAPDILTQIETRICEALGYAEHQRISAVHHDTDYLHIHIAINKIHPTRLTAHTPYYDYKILGKICEQLETEYGLVRTNHQTRQRGAANRANDMENAAGIESLLGWIQRECLASLQQATSWDDIHRILQENNLEISERGNGLVITDHNGVRVKASSVSREFSKKKLEEKFGAFTLPPDAIVENHTSKRSYRQQPLQFKIDTTVLYAKYREEQQFNYGFRATEWKKARDKKDRLIEETKRNNRLKRATIKFMGEGALSKKMLYSLARKKLKEDIKTINQQYAKERQIIYEKYIRRPWNDWLQYKAGQGDSEALTALRSRETVQSINGDTVSGKSVKNQSAINEFFDSVTKKGAIIYRVGKSAIRDDGNAFKLSREITEEGLMAALRMALHRYGEQITVNGSDEFKANIVRAAVKAKLPLTFDNPVLENQRQALLNPKKENRDEPRSNERTARRHTQYTGQPSDQRTKQASDKQSVGRVGKRPPPECKNHLRHLSELNVVRLTQGGEMLLSRDVPYNMELNRSSGTDELRWVVYRTGGITAEQITAADQYIAEREAKRLAGIDIPKHVHYSRVEDTLMIFSGIRHINERSLALLKYEQEMIVFPIDEKIAKKFKKLSIGDSVLVEKGGVIIIKGRSRKM